MTTVSRDLSDTLRDTLNGIREQGPEPLLELVRYKLRRIFEGDVTESDLLAAVTTPELAAAPRRAMHMALAQWDAQPTPAWDPESKEWSAERRARVYDLLELSQEARDVLDGEFPSASRMDTMIVDPERWTPWYTPARQADHDFYWRAYRGVLESKGWGPEAIAALNKSTTDIVGRLADPSAAIGYQTKGLVVGHVQSGKTANFTGILAKAIDSGYRLVIVLTGTIELLRSQTQRRLDMELVGEENILEGVDRSDLRAIREVDYIGTDDADWVNQRFVRHAVDIHSTPGIPAIKRLTTAGRDYKPLRLGRDALDFRRTGELRNSAKPVFDPENIYSADARLVVMKKNTASLNNLLRDLRNIRANLREIPVLIIDDEADQASVNTVNPRAVSQKADAKKRSAINKLINELLSNMPRAQYVGYTATPFANVFISPDDSADLFPKDFIVSLEPSDEYMGGRDFHDLWGLDARSKGDPSISNEAAFVRDLRADGQSEPEAERGEIRNAIDAFVLTGAIKKWREVADHRFSYRHHTMLVHESVKTSEHADLAASFRRVWSEAGYNSVEGLARLRSLFDADFSRVSKSREEWADLPMPGAFDELKIFIGAAVDTITVDNDPVVVVNGTRDSDYSAMDFQTRPYWRIMVGGAKLSRGFTVEGLTVSYYRRRATAADTLMQMGRWFGYRSGYNDLVRLYIGREVLDGNKKSFDLYDAFTSIIEDEEDFRDQLRRFSKFTPDGKPMVRPIHVPPMVFQQLPWLRPTGAVKMYNAVLEYEGDGGVVKDFNSHDYRGDGQRNETHLSAIRNWLPSNESPTHRFDGVNNTNYEARTRILSNDEVLTALRRFELLSKDQLLPTIAMIEKASEEGTLTDWVVIVPQLDHTFQRNVDGATISLMQRQRRADRPGFAGSERRHRAALETITRHPHAIDAGPQARELSTSTRGALLLTFTIDPEWIENDPSNEQSRVARARVQRENWPETIKGADVATLMSIALPYAAAPRGRIGFKVRRDDLENEAIVDI